MPCCEKLVVKPTAVAPAMAFSGAGETVRPAADSWDRPLASSSSRIDASPFVAVTTRLLANASTFFEDSRTRSTSGTPPALSVASAHPSGGTTVKLPDRARSSSPGSPAAALAVDTDAELVTAGDGSGVAAEHPARTNAHVRSATGTTRAGLADMPTIQPQPCRRSGAPRPALVSARLAA